LTHEPLRLASADVPEGESSGDRFPILDGIPDLLPAQDLAGGNMKYRELYDTIARGHDLALKAWGLFRPGGSDRVRAGFLKGVEVRAGSRALEVAVGTGGNVWFPYCVASFDSVSTTTRNFWPA
jgi:hypothetical protein